MLGRGLRAVGEQAGEPAVPDGPGRCGSRLVEDVADHVVGELVAGAGLGQQADPQRRLGSPGGVLDPEPEQLGDVLDVEGRAGDDGAAQELLDVRPAAATRMVTALRSEVGHGDARRSSEATALSASSTNSVWPFVSRNSSPASAG